MRKGISVQMTNSSMITYLGIQPVFEHTAENKQDAIDLCYKVLNIARDTDDNSMQVGMIAVVYFISNILELTEILNTDIIKQFTDATPGYTKNLTPEICKVISEEAHVDYEWYIGWISPFLSKAGVIDIQEELEDLDAIMMLFNENKDSAPTFTLAGKSSKDETKPLKEDA